MQRHLIFCCLAFTLCCIDASAQYNESTLELTSLSSIKTNPVYKNIHRVQHDPNKFEEAKIFYLIEIIRQSPYRFERNGKLYPSRKAARHLRIKYRAAQKHRMSALGFITNIASGSSLTGQPYFIVDSADRRYKVKDILTKELDKLTRNLNNTTRGIS